MPELWKMVVRVALGLFILAPGACAPVAVAQKATTESNGIVGMAIDLRADTVGAPARLVVRAVAPDGPAQRAGIRPGDEIVAVDSQSTNGKSLPEIVHMIRGKVGTAVTLTLSHEGQRHEVSVTRVEAVARHPHEMPRQRSHG